jgi:hypothetical protein
MGMIMPGMENRNVTKIKTAFTVAAAIIISRVLLNLIAVLSKPTYPLRDIGQAAGSLQHC